MLPPPFTYFRTLHWNFTGARCGIILMPFLHIANIQLRTNVVHTGKEKSTLSMMCTRSFFNGCFQKIITSKNFLLTPTFNLWNIFPHEESLLTTLQKIDGHFWAKMELSWKTLKASYFSLLLKRVMFLLRLSLSNDMIGETGMADSFDVSLSSSFIRKKSIHYLTIFCNKMS